MTQVFEGIQFIQMGGTIDKCYPSTATNHGYNFEVGQPAFNRILNKVAPNGSSWDVWEVVQKDSLDITDSDREFVRDHISRHTKRVIITHGTDTIKETARALSGCAFDRPIVLTGAMQPELFRDTDADFNLGMAVAAVQAFSQGVYIALYGQVKKWDQFIPH